MSVSDIKDLPQAEIEQICQEFGVRELSVFGSLAEGTIGPESDVDFLVEFEDEDLGPWMEKLQVFRKRLSDSVSRPVDVVLKGNIKWPLEKEIHRSARLVYAKR